MAMIHPPPSPKSWQKNLNVPPCYISFPPQISPFSPFSDSRFTQQELPACKPILTPGLVISTYVCIAIFFIPIGIASLIASQNVVEISYRYDEDCIPKNFSGSHVAFIQQPSTTKACYQTIPVPKTMKSPVYVYYQLDNFYQNHRRYVKSRNDEQLANGNYITKNGDCAPEDYLDSKTKTDPIVPCGLIAWSLFNDTYTFSVNRKPLPVSKKNIAWESDRKHKFGSKVYPKNFQNKTLIGGASLDPNVPLSEQEDLMVWMRTAALPSFRKLYGRIEEDLNVNDVLEVKLQNNYNSYMFKGKKTLVLSTANWIGGKNNFIGVAYLFVGGLNLFLALLFLGIYIFKPRPLGDPSYLSWNRNPDGLRR